jgi:hypothetical protein
LSIVFWRDFQNTFHDGLEGGVASFILASWRLPRPDKSGLAMTGGVVGDKSHPYESKSPSYIVGFLSELGWVLREMPVALGIYQRAIAQIGTIGSSVVIYPFDDYLLFLRKLHYFIIESFVMTRDGACNIAN